MGRTLSFSITKKFDDFSAAELKSINLVNKKYNSGQFEKSWSCENFWLETEASERRLGGFCKAQGNEYNPSTMFYKFFFFVCPIII